MQIKVYIKTFLKDIVKLYNKSKIKDSDFRPLSIKEFESKFINLPYKGEIFRLVYLDENNKPIGFLVADCDIEVEMKFGKKIAIIDLLIAEEKEFDKISLELISELEKRVKEIGIEEIQVHFVDEKNEVESNFFREYFEEIRKWHYMECNVYNIDNSLLVLPEGFRWERIRFRGPKANTKKWLDC
ncbi:MAG: hypothetical protein RXR31_07140, partial [Thermoproteota archaeon]